MKLADLPAVQALSPTEKLQLVDELWVALGPELDEMQVSPEKKKLLDDRWAAYLADPSSGLTEEEFRKQIDARRK